MVMRMTWLAIALFIATTLQVNIAGQKGYETFNKALAAEKTGGDLRAAIRLYEQAIRDAGKDRQLAAKALLRIGECYRRLGDAQARAVFTRIVTQYGDQADVVAEARARLETSDPAAGAAVVERLVAVVDGEVAFDDTHVTADGRLGGTDWANGDVVFTDLTTGRTSRVAAGGGPGGYPSWGEDPLLSPDRKQVAYQWFEEPAAGTMFMRHQLRVLSMEPGAQPRVLLNDPERVRNVCPIAWSADGQRLLVSFEIPVPQGASQPAGQGDFQLAWVSLTDARITPVRRIDWWRSAGANSLGLVSVSPDRRYLAFSAPPAQGSRERSVYALAIDGSSLVEIAAGGINEWPVWTPDGRNLLFVSDRAGSFGLSIAPVRDGKPAGLISSFKPNTGRIELRGFTAAGTLYFSRDATVEEIFIAPMERDGRVAAAVDSTPGTAPDWSPDGRSLALKRPRADGSYELVVRDMESKQEKRWSGMTAAGRPLGNARPVWLGNGSLMAGVRTRVEPINGELGFVSDRAVPLGELARDGRGVFSLAGDALPNGSRARVGVFDPATGQEQRSFAVPNGVVSVAVSPSGDVLALASPGRLAVVRTDGTDYREIYSTSRISTPWGGLGWSPDGRFVLFVLNEERGARLMRIPVAGGTPQPVELNGTSLKGFDASPDGTRIAYAMRKSSTELVSLQLGALLKK